MWLPFFSPADGYLDTVHLQMPYASVLLRTLLLTEKALPIIFKYPIAKRGFGDSKSMVSRIDGSVWVHQIWSAKLLLRYIQRRRTSIPWRTSRINLAAIWLTSTHQNKRLEKKLCSSNQAKPTPKLATSHNGKVIVLFAASNPLLTHRSIMYYASLYSSCCHVISDLSGLKFFLHRCGIDMRKSQVSYIPPNTSELADVFLDSTGLG